MNMREYGEAMEATVSQFLGAVDEITEGAHKRLHEERSRLRSQIAEINAAFRGDEPPVTAEMDYDQRYGYGRHEKR